MDSGLIVKYSMPSDVSVADVSEQGRISAISEGSAVITATTADGLGASDSCTVTVTAQAGEAVDYQAYYDTRLKPEMDNFGNNMIKRFTSADELKNAFQTAITAYNNLKSANNELDILKNDSQVSDYLTTLGTKLQDGQRRAESAPSFDSTLEGYKKDAAEYLKKYMERVKALLNIE